MPRAKAVKPKEPETPNVPVEPETPPTPPAPVEPEVSQPVETAAPKLDPKLGQAHVPVGSKAEIMRDKLAAEPKVRVLIPLSQGEKPGVTQSVILNGYRMHIRKGDYVEVPKTVAEVLEVKMKNKMLVENHPLRASRTGEVKMDVYGS